MAETPADVRRDIELTRERISSTLMQLEAKTNLMQVVKDHPWPALAVAVGAGVLLSGSRADVKAAGATLVATRGASSKVGTVLDDVISNLMGGVSLAFQQRVDSLVDELKTAIGAPTGNNNGQSQQFAGGQSAGMSGGSMGGNSYADRSGGMSADASMGASAGASQNSGMGALGQAQQGRGTPSSAGSQGLSTSSRAD